MSRSIGSGFKLFFWALVLSVVGKFVVAERQAEKERAIEQRVEALEAWPMTGPAPCPNCNACWGEQ